MDAANLLKPALASGELQCMGATTLDEYRKYIEKDLEQGRESESVPASLQVPPRSSHQDAERL